MKTFLEFSITAKTIRFAVSTTAFLLRNFNENLYVRFNFMSYLPYRFVYTQVTCQKQAAWLGLLFCLFSQTKTKD